ncbi:hypothetical protein J437_LFUL006344 [Ladona fulva]|uniref:Flap endonuclease GEN-like 1 n=1 Tax=Ladona fulva TaxID=123851 RepID=A0A8K0K251_LADFU|nr:hypothetical protein J437_LFUL006344 [Ladona fulva]
MGVKGLWTLLSPTCEKKALWELEGQTVAIDLSCWICDSQTITFAVNRPHLRNLFFRTSCLLLAGIRPVFVLEGKAPEIKQNEMRRRIQNVWNGVENNSRVKDTRPRFNSLIQQCCRLLEALGVCYIQSPGEGEATCAHLNAAGLADGCITQDNDCFLYGATTVYRNFSSSRSSKGCGFSVDAYDMAVVQKVLGLNREALVAIALICGCDYEGDECDGRGILGVGIETAAQFISGTSTSTQNIISRLKSWNRDPYFLELEREAVEIENVSNCLHCGHRGNLGRHDRVGCKSCDCEKGCIAKCDYSKENSLLNMSLEERRTLMLELGIRKKALVNPKFPSQAIIDEYLTLCNIPVPQSSSICWKRPDLKKFLEFSDKYLGWPEDYSLEKFFPLYTRWKILHEKSSHNDNHPYEVSPVCIKKQRASRGTSYYEVEWKMNDAVTQISCFTSLEPCIQFGNAYPVMAEEFQMRKKKPPKKGQKKEKVTIKVTKGRCNCGKNAGNQHHMCFFLREEEKLKADKVEGQMHKTNVEAITRSLVDLDLQDADTSSSDMDNMPEQL